MSKKITIDSLLRGAERKGKRHVFNRDTIRMGDYVFRKVKAAGKCHKGELAVPVGNEMKEYTIKITCTEAFYKALVTMLRYAKRLGQDRTSGRIAIYFRGKGRDKIHDMIISNAVTPTDRGILPDSIWGSDLTANWCRGDFLLDTDDVWPL